MTNRKAIRHAVLDLLATATSAPPAYPTLAGPNVYASRTAPLALANLPALLVYTVSDRPMEDGHYHQPEGPVKHRLTLKVEAAAAGEDADDTLDDLASQVEAVLDTDMNLGGLVESVRWRSVEMTLAGEGSDVFAVAVMEFDVAYWTNRLPDDGTVPTYVYSALGETPATEDGYSVEAGPGVLEGPAFDDDGGLFGGDPYNY